MWYPAREDAPTLPFESSFTSIDYDPSPLVDVPVGEVYGAPRAYNNQKVKTEALGKHQCGDPSDFVNGCERDTSLPPVEYYTNGLSKCCGYPPPIVPARFYRVSVGGQDERPQLYPYGSSMPADSRQTWFSPYVEPPSTAWKCQLYRYPSGAFKDRWFFVWYPGGGTEWVYETNPSPVDRWDGSGSRVFTFQAEYGPPLPHPPTATVTWDGET